MVVLLILAAIWLGGLFFGVSRKLRWTLIALVWAGVLALMWLRPDAALAGSIGGDAKGWAAAGMVFVLILAYRVALKLLRRRAETHPPETLVLRKPVSNTHLTAPVAVKPAEEKALHITSPRSDTLTEAELDRYARHITLREIGGPGQNRLRKSRVLIVGAGALGSPVATYLAAAGVGHITLADDDRVSLSNLQRQVIYRTEDIDRPKVEAARDALFAINPHVTVTPLPRRVGAEDVALLKGFDLVLDGTDSFASRTGVNAAAVAAEVPVVAGSIAQWEGQLTIWDPARGAPCMACIFPDAPAPGLAPSCAETGVVGALPGVIGSMMALEAIKLLTGAGAPARGNLTIYDGLWGETRTIAIARNPACRVCAGN